MQNRKLKQYIFQQNLKDYLCIFFRNNIKLNKILKYYNTIFQKNKGTF